MLGRSLHFGCTPPVCLFVIAGEEGVACKNIKHESLGDNNISHRGALTVIYGDRDALDWVQCNESSARKCSPAPQDWYHSHTKPHHSRFISLGNSFLPLHVRDLVPKSTDVSRRITAPLFIWHKIKFRSTSHRSFYQFHTFYPRNVQKKRTKCKLCSHLWWNSAARASLACEMPRFSTPQKPQKANKRAHLFAMIWSAAFSFSSSVCYLLCYTSTAQKPQANSFSNFLMYSLSTEH